VLENNHFSLQDQQNLLELLAEKEARLAQAQAHLSSVIKNTSISVFQIFPDGKIGPLPGGISELTCFGHACPNGAHISQLVHPDDLPEVTRHVANLVSGILPPDDGITFRLNGPEAKWVSVRMVSVAVAGGDERHFLGSAREVTQRRRLEQDLIATRQELQAVRRQMDTLANRPPPGALSIIDDIHKQLEIVKSQSSGMSPAARDAVEKAMEHCRKANVTLAVVAGGQETGQKGKSIFMDANLLAEMTIKALAAEAGQKGVVMVNSVPQHTRIHADPALMQLASRNLAALALNICVRADKVELFSPAGRGKILSARCWTQKSINEAEFTSGLDKLKALLAGSGSVAARVDDGGAVFSVELPDRRPVALLAEDDENLMFLLRTYMELIGVDVIEASNGKLALEAAKKQTPDIVLTDYQMPEMDGLEFLTAFRELPGAKEIPVIVATSVQERRLRERIFALGADDMLHKPITERDLIPRVRRFIC